jgi:hypothetical protein
VQPVRRDLSKVVGSGCVLIFGSVFALFSLIFMSVAWAIGAPWYFLAFGSIFLIAGFGMVGTGFWMLVLRPGLTALQVGQASASVEPQQARPGDRVTVRYEQPVRRAVEVQHVTIQLILRETATYRRGTNTYTAIHDNVIDQHEAQGRRYAGGETVSEACSLRLPPDAMHSFASHRNKLTWLIKVRIGLPGAPDVDEEIGMIVVPVVAGGTGDAGSL